MWLYLAIYFVGVLLGVGANVLLDVRLHQPALSQFVWGGDTYLVMDTTADPSWVSGNLAIKLSGAVSLSMADISFAG